MLSIDRALALGLPAQQLKPPFWGTRNGTPEGVPRFDSLFLFGVSDQQSAQVSTGWNAANASDKLE
jgi:hypothetical protein